MGLLRASGVPRTEESGPRRNPVQPGSLAKNLPNQMQFLAIAYPYSVLSHLCPGWSPGQKIHPFPNSAWLSATHIEKLIYLYIYL